MSILIVKHLSKKYPAFELQDVSFDLESGKITGFIGRNGAGKSTTLKCLLDFVHPGSGDISFFGMPFAENQSQIKQQIGFVTGGVDYYSKSKIKIITDVTRRFYASWDDDAYRRYMAMFKLDENKTPHELSEGMKVKYSLVLALSHNARLLILDEPTSGLDPVSRDDLLDVFLDLSRSGITIFFSTHITSDLDKCADNILYMKNGRILADLEMKQFVNSYKVARFASEADAQPYWQVLIGCKRTKEGCSALVPAAQAAGLQADVKDADLEEIMVHMEKEEI